MNRKQATAILANLELLKHFAAGGDIGFRLYDYTGKYVRTYPTHKLNLGSLHEKGTQYVRLKSKLRYDPALGAHVRVERSKLDPVQESEVITENNHDH